MSDATSLRMGPGRHTRSPSAACLAAQVAKPFLVSVCPVASDTRTPVGTRITCLARPAPLRQWPQIASQHRPTCDPKRSPLANSISAMPGGAAKSATTATGAWSTSPAGAPLRWQFRRLAWAKMRQVRMNVVPASDSATGISNQALLNNPLLLRRGPTPPPLPIWQDSHCRLCARSLANKRAKQSHKLTLFVRRSSAQGYSACSTGRYLALAIPNFAIGALKTL
jgi:hypothetical protein